ncbi:hypothetical protein KP509_09G076700 [Ceratopteris richardii]|uniref:Uncharacterized protein n=1 Tax=Ceratopteris richardii TaxID=49495 RepID=A0A8T2U1N0_CERRI|nr:hypothetical protein KP509_09G076700 [Ceratopteris richardii]
MAFLALPKALSLQWRRPEAQFMPLSIRPTSVRMPHSSLRIRAISIFDEEEEEDPNLYPNKYSEPVSLVTGASRGIGLEFTRQLLIKYPGTIVYGTARNPDASPGLQALKRRHPHRCELATMDVTKEETIEALAKEVNDKYGRLDLIVHCAGEFIIPDEVIPELYLEEFDPEVAMRLFEVNAVGPVLVTKHFWELLKIGHGTHTGRAGAVVVMMGHKCSSMKDNTFGSWYSYRASKTALNMFTRNMAMEAERQKDPILFTIIHPGVVNTQHSKFFAHKVPNMKLFQPDYAVERLLGILNKVRPEDNSKFSSWDRQEVPW